MSVVNGPQIRRGSEPEPPRTDLRGQVFLARIPVIGDEVELQERIYKVYKVRLHEIFSDDAGQAVSATVYFDNIIVRDPVVYDVSIVTLKTYGWTIEPPASEGF